jgi:FlaA1/EpsC-like NDP-sugar epimerase
MKFFKYLKPIISHLISVIYVIYIVGSYLLCGGHCSGSDANVFIVALFVAPFATTPLSYSSTQLINYLSKSGLSKVIHAVSLIYVVIVIISAFHSEGALVTAALLILVAIPALIYSIKKIINFILKKIRSQLTLSEEKRDKSNN